MRPNHATPTSAEKAPHPKLWGVMPAAGAGTRMELGFPKQYLKIAGKTVIEHSIEVMLGLDELAQLTVCLSADDDRFSALRYDDERLSTTLGGETRAQSVLNGLIAIESQAEPNDWVLVHDAARPCLQPSMLEHLVVSLREEETGGILAIPAKDTLKLAGPSEQNDDQGGPLVIRTLDRSKVWLAQTPQMFRYKVLLSALNYCIENGLKVTDEASALEQAGYAVKLIAGSAANIKVTNPEDQRLAEFLLS